ncbi:MAG: carbohydrate ABC transporter permease [Gammaproteobacteria bacterium]
MSSALNTRVGLERVGVFMYLFVISAIILIPMLWVFSTSLRLPVESYSLPPKWLPTDFRWENYHEVLFSYYLEKEGIFVGSQASANVPFLHMLKNSFVVCFFVTIGQILFCALAGYAFARLHFRGRNVLFWLIMATMMIPLQATIIPVYILISKMGLQDTLTGLILPAIPSAFGTFLMRQYYLRIPSNLEEASVIDGATQWQVFWKVYFPLGTPGMVVLGILAFNYHWNEFFRPLIFLSTDMNFTVPLGIVALRDYKMTGSVSVVLAGIIFSIIPALVIYLLGQKHLVEGILTGSMKG